MAKGILDLFRRGSGGRIAEIRPGPLTPGQRSALPGKLRRQPKKDLTDTDLRAALAAQIGALPAILEPLRPRNSATVEFSVATAKAYAREIGVNVFHLIDAGAKVEGLSRKELAEFVAEIVEFNKLNEAENQASENKNTSSSKGGDNIHRNKNEDDVDKLFDDLVALKNDGGSAFF